MQSTLTGLPLLGGDGDAAKEEPLEEENVSEKDSGTGDSKRSYDHDMEPNIVDHVIHNFLSARGEAGEWATLPPVEQTTTSMSDLDTGISSMGDSSLQQPPALHRKGCPRLKSIPPPPSTRPPAEEPNPGLTVVGATLAVGNPLYDQLPGRTGETVASAPPSDCTASPPASIISDSVAYCGRFPPPVRGQCRQCGELERVCGHQPVEQAESVSSARSSTVLSGDQPITFNTFHPFRAASNHDRGPESSAGGSDAGSGREESKRKRLSAIELPTGETYLSIESPGLPTSITVEKDLGLVAREYRGGGTLPRHGLQQEWLEASLARDNDSHGESVPLRRQRSSKERSSRRSVFRSSRRLSAERAGSLPRRKSSTRAPARPPDSEHSEVASKSKEMF